MSAGRQAQKYCHACGRIMSRKAQPPAASTPARSKTTVTATTTPMNPPTERKYCSHTCKTTAKPTALDRSIEREFISRIEASRTAKEARRTGVLCSLVQSVVFPDAGADGKVSGEDGDDDAEAARDGTTPGAADDNADGMRRAKERERVRRAGRRIVVFPELSAPAPVPVSLEAREASGLDDGGSEQRRRRGRGAKTTDRELDIVGDDTPPRRRYECVQDGRVVEGSFAKGDWGVRLVQWP